MLTPISPASAKSRASSPGWSGTETKTERGRSRRAAVLAGDRRGAGDAAARGSRPGRAPVAGGDRGDQRVEVARAPRRAGRARRRRWRRRSAATARGRSAATRVTSRTPWPDSARCSAGASASRPATSDGEQVRQVRGAGDGPVVLVGVQPHRDGAAQRDQRLDQRRPRRRRRPRAASPPTGGRRRARRSRPAARSARCRPSGGSRRSGPGRRRRPRGHRRQRAGLDAADVGDDARRCARSASTIASAMAAGGTATTTSCGRSPAVAGPTGAEPGGGAQVLRRRRRAAATSRPAARQASAIEVPSRPAPTTSTGPVRAGERHRRARLARRVRSRRSAAAPCR